jgi:putative glycosyltransferase (TIGR04372 family)
MEFRKYPKIIRTITHVILNLFLIPISLPLIIIKYLFRIQFIRILDLRIGHLAANTELHLRRVRLGITKNRFKYVGIASTTPANRQLLKMFKRRIKILQIPQPKLINFILTLIANHSILKKTELFYPFPYYLNEYFEFGNTEPSLRFTKKEGERGKEILKKIGINNNWFICFHARDGAYLESLFRKNEVNYNGYRDWDIKSSLSAIKYITSLNGYAIRMGAVVEKELPNLENKKIIDYACKYRTDFGDIYLPSKCKFFLGDGCGLNLIPKIFNKPVVWVNLIPLKYPPLTKEDLFILKKIWSIPENRLLTFQEIINRGIVDYEFNELYENDKLKIINNSSQEIEDVVKEMNERLDGTWITTKEDEELQQKFKLLFDKNSHCYQFPSRIGAKFLRENKNLLE